MYEYIYVQGRRQDFIVGGAEEDLNVVSVNCGHSICKARRAAALAAGGLGAAQGPQKPRKLRLSEMNSEHFWKPIFHEFVYLIRWEISIFT